MRYTDKSSEIAVWEIDESVDELLDFFPETSRTKYVAAICEFRSERRRQEWLATRLLLCILRGEDGKVCYRSDGKPYIEGADCHIGISHTERFAAVIVNAEQPVSIDIERYGTRVWRVAKRFLRDDECPLRYGHEFTWSLLLHWSGKETLYKYMKHPVADFRLLRVLTFIPHSKGEFRMQDCSKKKPKIYYLKYLLHDDFVMTWIDVGAAHLSDSLRNPFAEA